MKLRVLLLFATLLPSACATTDNFPDAACRRAAYDDPQARELAATMMQNQSVASTMQGQLKYLRRQAYLRCMQDRGLAVPGGVEPVRPPIP